MSKKAIGALIILFALSLWLPVFASETVGTISTTNKYSWAENMGWINFAPDNTGSYQGLTITDTAVTGYAWSKEFGWINFNPTNSGQGVVNTGEGHLSGKAWVATLGWLDMHGVIINSSGKFTGTAGTEGDTVGRISFDCDHCNVTTDWRPASARVAIQSQGGSGGYTPPVVPPTTTTTGGTVPLAGGGTVLTGEVGNDPIGSLYNQLGLSQPDRTPGDDYVESYGKPLTIHPNQHGLLAYAFSDGSSALIQVPKGIGEDTLTIEVSTAPAVPGADGPFTYIFGGVKFTVTAKDSHGNLVHHFAGPLTITLGVPLPLTTTKDLGIYWMDTTTNAWVLVPGTTFTGTTGTFLVDHLTEFAILQAKGLPGTIPITPTNNYPRASHQTLFWTLGFLILFLLLILLLRRRNKKELYTQ